MIILFIARHRCATWVKETAGSIPILKEMEKKHWDVVADSIAGLCAMYCVLLKKDLSLHKTLAIVLLLFFLLEFLAKWFMMGINGYFRDVRNKMDFAVGVLMFLILLIGSCTQELFQGFVY